MYNQLHGTADDSIENEDLSDHLYYPQVPQYPRAPAPPPQPAAPLLPVGEVAMSYSSVGAPMGRVPMYGGTSPAVAWQHAAAAGKAVDVSSITAAGTAMPQGDVVQQRRRVSFGPVTIISITPRCTSETPSVDAGSQSLFDSQQQYGGGGPIDFAAVNTQLAMEVDGGMGPINQGGANLLAFDTSSGNIAGVGIGSDALLPPHEAVEAQTAASSSAIVATDVDVIAAPSQDVPAVGHQTGFTTNMLLSFLSDIGAGAPHNEGCSDAQPEAEAVAVVGATTTPTPANPPVVTIQPRDEDSEGDVWAPRDQRTAVPKPPMAVADVAVVEEEQVGTVPEEAAVSSALPSVVQPPQIPQAQQPPTPQQHEASFAQFEIFDALPNHLKTDDARIVGAKASLGQGGGEEPGKKKRRGEATHSDAAKPPKAKSGPKPTIAAQHSINANPWTLSKRPDLSKRDELVAIDVAAAATVPNKTHPRASPAVEWLDGDDTANVVVEVKVETERAPALGPAPSHVTAIVKQEAVAAPPAAVVAEVTAANPTPHAQGPPPRVAGAVTLLCDLCRVAEVPDARGFLMCARPDEASYPAPINAALLGYSRYYVHVSCALWSPEVYFEPHDDAAATAGGVPHHGEWMGVADAIKRGNLIKCAYCRTFGATIGCTSASCQRSYHYHCACDGHQSRVVMDHAGITLRCHKHAHGGRRAEAAGSTEGVRSHAQQPPADVQ